MKFCISLFLILCVLFCNNDIKCTTVVESTQEGSQKPQNSSPSAPESGSQGDSSSASSNSSIEKQPQEPNQESAIAGNVVSQGTPANTSSQTSDNPDPTPANPSDQTSKNPSGQTSNDSSNSPQATSAPSNPPKSVDVKSAFLKHYKGVKVTGSCNANFQLFLVPHIFINVETKENNIQLDAKFMKLTERIHFEKDTSKLKNKCESGKKQTFKFVLYLKEDILTLKWKVDEEKPVTPPKPEENTVDIRLYKLPKLDQPITSIQVHTLAIEGNSYLMESKDYSLGNNIPEKCDAIASDCFLSGNINIEKCLKCTLKVKKAEASDECYKYVSKDEPKETKPAQPASEVNQVKAASEDYSDDKEYELSQSINNILNKMYKKQSSDEKNNKKELIKLEDADDSLQEELNKYCNSLKEVDVNGVLSNNEVGNEKDVFNNLTILLKEHMEENEHDVFEKLKNSALCLKNINDWLKNKTGLIIPPVKNNLKGTNEKKESNNNTEVNEDMFKENEYGIVDLTKFPIDTNYLSYKHIDYSYCNNDYCNWSKDKNSCISHIGVEDQKNCALSWAFASKYHLETIKCMKGYEHTPISSLYIANCSKNENEDVCTEGSNPLKVLQMIEEKGFLPTEVDYSYEQSKVGETCPEVQNEWVNLWGNAKLLEQNNDEQNSLSTKGYTSYESETFKKDMHSFVKLIKDEIMNKGSVIAYVKADKLMGYGFNGKKVQNLCGDKTPDHAVNIIGYGNYINDEGHKKSYWIVRNSWGKYWGDKGQFKVDMYGPSDCEDNFIHSVVVFNVDLPVNEESVKKEPKIYNYYLKASPDFYHNLYFKNFDSQKDKVDEAENKNSYVYGQDEPAATVSESSQGSPSPVLAGSSPLSKEPSTEPEAPSPAGVKTPGTAAPESSSGAEAEGKAAQGTVASEAEGKAAQGKSAPAAVSPQDNTKTDRSKEKVDIFHVLKHIKDGKIKMGLVKYDHSDALGDDHACSRSYSSDPEKQEGCVKFCNENWGKCKDTPSPGFCLSELEKTDDCFFCYI
ncbi:serine repeat antigen 3 [Plasmodium sp. DRC-Itaito]|nr:serine repeat antigen 3 [Plasmodium sp. DRC-Itaito]